MIDFHFSNPNEELRKGIQGVDLKWKMFQYAQWNKEKTSKRQVNQSPKIWGFFYRNIETFYLKDVKTNYFEFSVLFIPPSHSPFWLKLWIKFSLNLQIVAPLFSNLQNEQSWKIIHLALTSTLTFHIIREKSGLEGTLWGHLVQLPAQGSWANFYEWCTE